jgi:hypothetical protein
MVLQSEIHAQEGFEVLIQTDNDFFVPSIQSDKNYTYGIFAGLRMRKDSSKSFVFSNKAIQNIHAFRAGIMGFTPDHKLANFNPENPNDRPHAGWLFGEYVQHYICEASEFSVGLQVGTLGDRTQAGEIQNEFHEWINSDFVEGWDTQIPNQWGANIIGSYRNILKSKSNRYFYFVGKGSLGTVNTSMDHRMGFAFGKNPVLFPHSRLTSNSEEKSFFIQLEGGANFVFYDATLQGNIFEDNDFFTAQEFNNIKAVVSGSLNFLVKTWTFVFSGTYESEVIDGENSHRFGTIQILKTIGV